MSEARERLTKLCEQIEYLPAAPYWMARIEDAADIRQLLAERDALAAKVDELRMFNRTFEPLIERLTAERDALAAFKAFVHRRLDEAGIPTHPDGPHSKEGCRIGDRLDIALQEQAMIEGVTSWEFACKWYGVDEIANAIARDGSSIPKDVASREFSDWLCHQYRLAMNKGIQLGHGQALRERDAANARAEQAERERDTLAKGIEQVAEGTRRELAEAARQLEQAQAACAAMRQALVKLWKHTPKIGGGESGTCLVCRIGQVRWVYPKPGLSAISNPQVSECSNADCLSHVVRAALAKGAAKESGDYSRIEDGDERPRTCDSHP